MTEKHTPATMRDLMAQIGHVLMCWGYVENAIHKRLPAGDQSKASALVRWRNAEPPTPEFADILREIERLAIVRNCIAHGLKSASAKLDQEPFVVCRTQGDDKRLLLSELHEAERALHLLSHRIRALPKKLLPA